MKRVGLAIADDSGDLGTDAVFDTSRQKLTVDLDASPKHFDILPKFNAGTKFYSDGSGNKSFEETLFKIEHKLPFEPMIQAFFLRVLAEKDATISEIGLAPQYSINTAPIIFNAMGLGSEWLEATADSKYFYIKHYVESTVITPYTFVGSDAVYRVRYMILNQPTVLIPGGVDDNL
jgi:hypothetical protein